MKRVLGIGLVVIVILFGGLYLNTPDKEPLDLYDDRDQALAAGIESERQSFVGSDERLETATSTRQDILYEKIGQLADYFVMNIRFHEDGLNKNAIYVAALSEINDQYHYQRISVFHVFEEDVESLTDDGDYKSIGFEIQLDEQLCMVTAGMTDQGEPFAYITEK